ncbi:MAG TPA: acyl-CoA dehydrogenase family protein [Acidimicrobiia bacterium]|nr:acyl-CoA dehydrogenase family protein [Acidimicrobiia bacterium]
MRFAFTDDQLAFRDAVRALLDKECPPAVVRAAWTNADGRSGAAWTALGEMGALGVLVAEADGGLGLSELDAVLLAEETGRAALPEPFVEHVLVGAPIVGGEDYATGAATVTAGDPLVPYADSADAIVRLGHDSFRCAATAASLDSRQSVDGSRRLFSIDGAEPRRALTRSEVSTAYWRGVLGFSAQLVGLAHHLLDVTIVYVTDRRQFGAPIGSFQALKHKLADVRIAIEFSAPLVYRAAYSLAHADPEAAVHVSMAKAAAADAATLAARHALQCHGAIGYSDEHDLHLWMKRVWALAATWGDADWHRDRVARATLDRT